MPPSRSSRPSRSRRTGLNLDLNDEPPVDNLDLLATSMCSHPHFGVPATGVGVPPTAPIDLEAFEDDDVIVSSPRAFAEAKNKSQRNHERARVVDLDLATHKRRRTSVNQTSINSGIFINLEASANSAGTNAGVVDVQQSPQPPPKELTFNCPVCMGPLVEEMSTKCGHIFCKECIKAAIAAQKKCPTCRRRVTPKDIIRVYLPATSCS